MGQKLRNFLKHNIVQLALVGLISGAGFWAGHMLDLAIGRQAIIQQFDLDGRKLLSRLELVIDQSQVELKHLAKTDLLRCGTKGLAAARMTVLSRGTLKDIEVRGADGGLRCASMVASAALSAKPRINSALELPGIEKDFLIGVAENKADGLLQLRKAQTDGTSLVAFVGLDTLLYSFFDPGVRDMASVGIYFDKTKPVTSYGEIQSIRKVAGGFDVELGSLRFPLSVRLSVPETSIRLMMSARESLTQWLMAIAGGLLSVLGSYVAISAYVRPPNPEKELAVAIGRDEIVPFYQPIVSLCDNRISGCEMLVRWIKPDGTMVRPDLFIPLAESSGLIGAMTLRVMRRAIRELAPVMGAQASFKLAINISPDHFSEDGFLTSILRVLSEEGLDPAFIVLELTERQQMQDLDAFKLVAEAAQNAGLRISIDDVGTGHNGLSTIQDVPANIIKIDKKFVDTIATNALSAAIVAMLVGLSKQFGRMTVAEGIETIAQLEALQAQGVDEGQGYLFSPALDALRFIAFYGTYKDTRNKPAPSSIVKAAA